ncbi:MAG: VanZ family protein [Candidatus Promineifilaceae bacterium]|nr:VanZ family protein [Candidatus Promineifilaceae bacterium]
MTVVNQLSPRHRRLLAWLAVFLWAGLIFAVSAQPQARFQELGLSGTLLSFSGHLFSYAVLMTLLAVAIRVERPQGTVSILLAAFLLTALYGLTDEFHQSFVPGRRATWDDWLVDLLGAFLVGVVLWTRWARQRSDEADYQEVKG